MNYQEYQEEKERALDLFVKEVHVNKETAMGKFQELRDDANELARMLARKYKNEISSLEAAEEALAKQEYEDILKQLEDMARIFEGLALRWDWVEPTEFTKRYEKVEVVIYQGNTETALP